MRNRQSDVDLPPGVRRFVRKGKVVPGMFVIRAQGKGYDVQRTVEARTGHAAAILLVRLREDAERPAVPTPPPAPVLPTLGDYAHSFVKSKVDARELKASSASFYLLALMRHILPALGHLRIDEIRSQDVAAWLEAQRGASDSVNARLRVLKTVVRAAVERYELPKDPTAKAKPRRRTEPVREKAIDVDELERLLAAVRALSPQWFDLILTLARTGARFSEATALKWSDVDQVAGTITIRRGQWRGHIGTPKTGKVRFVRMTPDLAAVLRLRREQHVRDQVPELGEGWLFVTRPRDRENSLPTDYVHLRPSSIRKPLARAAKAAGVRIHFTTHCWRHTANNALRQHDPLGLVTQSAIGHSDTAMTARYSRVALAEQDALLRRAFPAAFEAQRDPERDSAPSGAITLDVVAQES